VTIGHGSTTDVDNPGQDYDMAAPISGSRSLDGADAIIEGSTNDNLGFAIAVLGDVDGDGLADVGVGAPGTEGPFLDTGAAYLVLAGSLDSGFIEDLARSTLLGISGEDETGAAIGGGDLDGDGTIDVVVGGPNAASGYGAVDVVYAPPAGVTSLDLNTKVLGMSFGDEFGSAILIDDLNGDGFSDVAIGGPGYDVAAVDAGASFLFLGGVPVQP